MQAGAKRKIFFTWPSAAEISPAESLLRIPGSCYSDDHWEEEYQPHFFGLFVIPSECEESHKYLFRRGFFKAKFFRMKSTVRIVISCRRFFGVPHFGMTLYCKGCSTCQKESPNYCKRFFASFTQRSE